EFQVVLGIISLGGAVFLLLLGWQSLRVKTIELCIEQKASQSLLKGVLANFLSPHPYLFWISVGGPMMIRATQIRLSAGVVFICGFYLCLIGAKIFLAILVGQSKSFLSGACYPRIIRSLGILLILLAGLLFYDGLKLLQFY
ncbi:MAG: LysE family transporter, partial [Deltaproteobacteria bacterium]|nr:LysE family transporter [Deltaproteobacteria bacterium]